MYHPRRLAAAAAAAVRSQSSCSMLSVQARLNIENSSAILDKNCAGCQGLNRWVPLSLPFATEQQGL